MHQLTPWFHIRWRAVGIGNRAFAAQLVKAAGVAEFLGKFALVEISPARAVLMYQLAVEQFGPFELIQVLGAHQACQQG